VHWSKKSKSARKSRAEAAKTAMAAGLGIKTFEGYGGKIHLRFTGICPTRHYIDDDNFIASLKSSRDGIADALGVDDKRFVSRMFISERTIKGGSVIVEISKGVLPDA
jgi:hypothetical protein